MVKLVTIGLLYIISLSSYYPICSHMVMDAIAGSLFVIVGANLDLGPSVRIRLLITQWVQDAEGLSNPVLD